MSGKIIRIIVIISAFAVILYAIVPAVKYRIQKDEIGKGIVNPDFETGDLTGWTKTGNAFDYQPTLGDNIMIRRKDKTNHQRDWWIGGFEKYQGKPGQNPGDEQGDQPTGTLTSSPFVIKTDRIAFLIGGGRHPWVEPDGKGSCCVNLVIDGKVVKTATGPDHETMNRYIWNVSKFKGKKAVIQVVDKHSGGWGHVNFDDVFQTTRWHTEKGDLIVYLWAGVLLLMVALVKRK
ncbi:hypothetical protein GF312_22810 [Candidatus Poribacteria bacterium]|nr:hypothetical protein [Candidatus Poribacteria bacterium]